MIEDNPVLGPLIASYPSDRGRLLLPAALMIGAVAIVLNYTVAEVAAWWGPVLTVILMALVVLVVGWYVLHHWNREVVLFEQGFSYYEGSRPVFFRYTEIAHIHQRAERLVYLGGLYRRTVYRFVLTTGQGDVIVLTNLYRRVAELGTRMEQKVNEVLWPVMVERLANGETVMFSASFGLSAGGLHEGGRDLTWDEYGGYRIENRQLALLKQTGEAWFAVPLSDVDNVTLLLQILREHDRNRQDAESARQP